MGKSDPLVFNAYATELKRMSETLSYDSALYLGQPNDNAFTATLNVKKKSFLDLSLNNWNINSGLELKDKFDLIVCTRCAYFSKRPNEFIESVHDHLAPNGIALIDWGLGDHWRFEKYKVGWVRDNEHEFAYRPDNLLHSTMWRDEFQDDQTVRSFWDAVQKKYESIYGKLLLNDVVKQEVPSIVDYQASVKMLALWPDNPQLYIITLIKH